MPEPRKFRDERSLDFKFSRRTPFCRRAKFIFSSERRILGFEVFASQADDLDVGEVLQQGDRFDFSGGKYAGSDQVFFIAQTKDKKILIQFRVDGRRSILSLVSYFYRRQVAAYCVAASLPDGNGCILY
jgi:hypothetical protein